MYLNSLIFKYFTFPFCAGRVGKIVSTTRQIFALVGFLTLLALPCLNSSREFHNRPGALKKTSEAQRVS